MIRHLKTINKMAFFYRQFEISAQKYSSNNSILFCDNTRVVHQITYSDLTERINSFTSILEKNIVDKNICIGILIEPNPLLVAAILSIQKHECCFFCMDPNTFSSNIIHMIQNMGISYIFIYNLNQFDNKVFKNRGNLLSRENNLEFWKIMNNKTVFYKDISYIILTSGTTGQNKIVKVQENCIMSNINSLREIFKISSEDNIFLGTPVTFDPFIVELMLALTTGASLFIVDSKIKHNKKVLLQTLFPEKNLYPGITFLQIPPSVLLCFPEKDIKKFLCEESSLRILALGGENFPKEIFKYKNWSKNLKVFNLYGITEVSCWASVEEVSEFDEEVSLGKLLNDTVFQIRDDFGIILEKGEGNLFIVSEKRICLIDDEIFTDKSIIFRDTGDIVKLDETSNKIFYVGRKNNIIKRLGHKVNLSSIQKSVYDLTNLTSICVWDEIRCKLILFLILQENDKIVRDKIIDKLRIKLVRNSTPIFIPDVIEIIPSIPLTVNGKTDKKCLLQIANLSNESLNLPAEQIFENLWAKYLGCSSHEINIQKLNSFLSLGGNSILAIQLISEFDSKFDNSYSGNLMEMLLDSNKTYSDYLNLIKSNKSNNLKRASEFRNSEIKCKKLEINSCIKNYFEIKIAWTFNMDACVDSSPVYFTHPRLGNLIAVGSHGQKFVVLNAGTGESISENILPDAVEGLACIVNNEIAAIGCNDGIIYFIRVENGQIVSKFITDSSVKSTPILCCESKKILVGSYDKHLYCLNTEGNLEWKFATNESIKSNAIANNKYAYVATINGSYFCICIDNGILKWKNKSNTPVFGSPAVIENEKIIVWADVKGHVNCFDCDNGDKLWVYEASGFIYSSLRNINNKILFGCFDHNVYCLECTRNGCVESFKINIEGQISTTPFVFNLNDKTYFLAFNNKGLLHVVHLESVILQQTLQMSAEVFSSPITIGNQVYFGCRDNNVYCLKLEIKK